MVCEISSRTDRRTNIRKNERTDGRADLILLSPPKNIFLVGDNNEGRTYQVTKEIKLIILIYNMMTTRYIILCPILCFNNASYCGFMYTVYIYLQPESLSTMICVYKYFKNIGVSFICLHCMYERKIVWKDTSIFIII